MFVRLCAEKPTKLQPHGEFFQLAQEIIISLVKLDSLFAHTHTHLPTCETAQRAEDKRAAGHADVEPWELHHQGHYLPALVLRRRSRRFSGSEGGNPHLRDRHPSI